jgi:RNase P/RNase MRP subunit POP5
VRIRKLPSMRGRRRYLTFRLRSRKPVIYSEMKGAALNSILGWMGEEGFSKADVWIIKNLWDGESQTGWLRCSLGAVDDVRVALALVHQIGEEKVIIRTMRVSGTIKSGRKRLGAGGR